MKKTYIAPTSETIELSAESMFLLGSLTDNGSLNIDVNPGDEYNGDFSTNKKGWDSSNWSGEE